MHARHTQMMSPRLCTTKHFTMTQLKLFTLVGVANLLLEVSPEPLYGDGPNYSRRRLLFYTGRRRYNAVVRVCMIYWLRFQNFLQKDMYILVLDNSLSQWVFRSNLIFVEVYYSAVEVLLRLFCHVLSPYFYCCWFCLRNYCFDPKLIYRNFYKNQVRPGKHLNTNILRKN
jgi:hypothetical protein